MKSNIYSFFWSIILFSCLIHFSAKAQVVVTPVVMVQPCNSNGQASVSVTGLTPPINYTYSSGNWGGPVFIHTSVNSTTDMITGLPAYQQMPFSGNANYWIVSASDGSNFGQGSFSLTPPFTDSIKVNNVLCPGLSSLQAQSFAGGTAPFTCVWTNTLSSLNYTGNPMGVPNGVYTVVITDAGGCKVESAPTFSGGTIQVFGLSNINLSFIGSAANCTNGTASVTATGGTAPYSYLWSNSAATQNLGGLTQGWYTCVVTDAVGCQKSGGYNVTQGITINFNTSVTNATCLQNNGSILSFVSGGTAPYTFAWSNGGNTQNLSGLNSGFYQVQITDANGCTRFGGTNVSSSTPINVTYTATASSCTAATGSATLSPSGGAAPYSVIWSLSPTNAVGLTISNRFAGNYAFTVTDANGCLKTGLAVIPFSSTLTASLPNAIAACPSTLGVLQMSVNGSNPPFSYLWSNSASSSSISVPLGAYNCTVTDAAGCKLIKSSAVYASSPIFVGFIPTAASCLYNSDGSVTATAFGGLAPYTYSWTNGQSGPTATALATGNYYVMVSDANGCTNSFQNSQVHVGYNINNNSCYCTITGTVYADANTNCVQNLGDFGIPNLQVHCAPFGYAFTSAFGVYSFKVPSGTYTISRSPQANYPLTSCQNNNQIVTVSAASNCSSVVNFACTVTPVHDLRLVTINQNLPVPGNVYQQRIILHNDGTIPENNIKFGYRHDGQLTYSNSTNWSLVQQNPSTFPSWYSITNGFPLLNPFASSNTFLNYYVPTNVPLNTLVNFKDTAAHAAPISTNWLLDNSPWNNRNEHNVVVIGPYDPNFKEVSPKGTGSQGNITVNDSMLTYVVHFQNEGTYFAQNVVVLDTLDINLNIESVRPGYSDHSYEMTIDQNRAMKFNFKNIQLPWKSAYGDVLSSGLFVYTVKLKKNLPVGTQIKNKAAIYFDYNEPIITNSVLNTIFAPVSLTEIENQSKDQQYLFPNPATNRFNLQFKCSTASRGLLLIYDISGRLVSNNNYDLVEGENIVSEQVGQLQNGIYLVQVLAENLKFTKKLIISK